MKALKIKIRLDGEQEDDIVAKSIKESYYRNDHCGKHDFPEDWKELRKAFKVVYHYYSGKVLK
jgi:hypothetical protein